MTLSKDQIKIIEKHPLKDALEHFRQTYATATMLTRARKILPAS
jgi:hypothetical protein